MMVRLSFYRYVPLLPALVLTAALGHASAQTVITADKNKYSVADDVKVGQEAAAEARRQLPMLNDNEVDDYVEEIGRRLVAAVPPQFRHPEFRYSFEVINQKEINAFALPGGPMFLNRGMIESARNEGEVAGVMAHELAHVALRHGTAQATKGEKFQIGSIAGQILGAVVGGTAGSVISGASQIGLGTYFLKYGREYERQADLLGAQMMASAGYDPRRMADMFRTIEQQSRGSGGPEWMSSHPNPGNRHDAIMREAAQLQVRGNVENNAEFQQVRARLNRMSPAYTAEQIARGQVNRRDPRDNRDVARAGRISVEPPSTRYRSVPIGNFLNVNVPQNWDQLQGNNTVVLAPDGGYLRSQNGATSFTHGLEVGVIRNETHNLQQGTEELIDSFSRSNPDLRMQGGYRRENIGGRNGMTAYLTNTSDATGERERVTVSTVQLNDGSLLYLVGVAPERESNQYDAAFRRARQTLQIRDQSTRR